MANFFKSLFKSKEETPESGKSKSDKKNFEIFKFDGLRAQRMGRIDYSIKCFTSALEIEEEFETLGYLSQAYIRTHQLDEARRMLERMIALEPEFVDTYVTLANVCYMQEKYADMAQAAGKAIEMDNENPSAHFLLAKAHQGLKNDIMVIAQLTKAIALKADFMEALILRAEMLTTMKQYPEAMKDIEAVLAMNDEEESALLLRGKLKEATANEAGAESDYKLVTELNPFNEQAYIYLAQLYIAQKKLTEAIALMDEAVELNPTSAAAFHERGRARLLNGDKDGAAQDMKQALELNPKEAEQVNGEFNYKKGVSDSVFGGHL